MYERIYDQQRANNPEYEEFILELRELAEVQEPIYDEYMDPLRVADANGTINSLEQSSRINAKGRTSTSRPTWRQSELDAASDFPDYNAQKSFTNGKEVPYGTKGSVRPDYYKDGFSVDIKNYNVESASGRSN